MSTYLYELPTTGAIFFAGVCDDKTGSYTTEIAEATEARANLRAALKESKRADDGGKDYLKLVKVLDDYLPQLYGIATSVQQGELVLKTEPIFSWRTTLSSSIFHNSPRISIPTLSTEVIFTLLTYAFAFSNLSRTVVHSLGAYERERAISDAERRAKDEKLQFAVTLLCKASGVFEYIAKDCIQEWERERERVVAAGLTCPRPPDLTREVVVGLSKMALADAQTLAIRKLLSRAAFDSTITPGPPLPKSHPSPLLIAKLHLECAALYASARSLAKTPGDYRPASSTKSRLKQAFTKDKGDSAVRDEGGEEVALELRRYLAEEVAFHSALSHKWLGVDAGENGATSKAGEAVAFLAWAKKELEDLRGGPHVMGSDREKDMRERRKERVAEELESVSVFLKGYKNMNDTVAFQPVPPQSDLQASIPAGRLAVTVKPFTKPTPAFGPGSAAFIRRQTEELELATRAVGEDTAASEQTDITSPQSGRSYAGEGSYF
ncbi:BRO1 domain-containing protein [Fomitopsis serialis]|uniref:BRO1 domain-containing protein n=1 Tax=Fomitopsis serialis TaxID=139415 RepID=UPI002007820B|nr:BRO1 domain-containing protein [Neoantrodia serialis]KAH9935779.1 BRO1 domain-containing protein [Neoantrodia serialis]